MSLDVEEFPSNSVRSLTDIEGLLESGDLLFASGNGRFSRMIKWATGSVWSHVAFVLRLDVIDTMMVMESVENIGVRTVPLKKYVTDYDSASHSYDGGLVMARHSGMNEALKDLEKLELIANRAVGLLGYPYDGDEIARIAARIAISSIPGQWGRPHELERDREFICSEFVEECFHAVGVDLPNKGYITPTDIASADEVQLLAVLQTAG